MALRQSSIKQLNRILQAFAVILIAGCTHHQTERAPQLSTVVLQDRNGFSETISQRDRLERLASQNFDVQSSYQKIIRVYQRGPDGDISSILTTYYPNGQLHHSLEVRNGRASGRYAQHYASGQLKMEAVVVGGVADLTEAAMASWQFEGMALVYYPSGQLQARIPYQRGCLEGAIERLHPCGALASREPFSGGLLEGVEQSWAPDGQLQSQVGWKGGERHGQSRQWHASGSLFSDEWWDSGRLQSGAYFMADLPSSQLIGVTDGAGWRPQLLEGALIQVSQFQAGRPQGWIRNYCRGVLNNEWEVLNGQKNGLERFFDPKTGKIKLEMSWQDDVLSGPCRSFFPSEKLESQWEMLDNQRHGRLVSWYRSGALMMIEDYERGRLVRGDYYEPGGGQPVSQVVNGNGTASLFLSDGRPSKVVAIQEGTPIP